MLGKVSWTTNVPVNVITAAKILQDYWRQENSEGGFPRPGFLGTTILVAWLLHMTLGNGDKYLFGSQQLKSQLQTLPPRDKPPPRLQPAHASYWNGVAWPLLYSQFVFLSITAVCQTGL